MANHNTNFPCDRITKKHGANLPHWTAADATYFVTFRLADSLPQKVIEAYKQERERLLAAFIDAENNSAAPAQFTLGDAKRLHELFSERVEKYLDAGVGKCWMSRPEIADIVQDALLFFHSDRYILQAWSVMPNHAHAVVQPVGSSLSDILHSWKSFTAKKANKIIGRTGEFWQSESFDHLVRNDAELQHYIEYTLSNPVKANLRNWRWAGTPQTIGGTPMPRGTGVPPVSLL